MEIIAIKLNGSEFSVGDSMGWTRTVPHPDERGLNSETKQRLRPRLIASGNGKSSTKSTGISETERAGVGEFILKNMGLTQTFARLILLAGHGSTTRSIIRRGLDSIAALAPGRREKPVPGLR